MNQIVLTLSLLLPVAHSAAEGDEGYELWFEAYGEAARVDLLQTCSDTGVMYFYRGLDEVEALDLKNKTKIIIPLKRANASINSLAIPRQGNIIALGTNTGLLIRGDKDAEIPFPSPVEVASSRNGLIAAVNGNVLSVWDPRTLRRKNWIVDQATFIAIDTSDRLMIATDMEGDVCVYENVGGEMIIPRAVFKKAGGSWVRLLKDGRRFVSVRGDNRIVVGDFSDGWKDGKRSVFADGERTEKLIDNGETAINGLCVSSVADLLVYGDDAGHLTVYNYKERKRVFRQRFRNEVQMITATRDLSFLAAVSYPDKFDPDWKKATFKIYKKR